MSRTVPVLLAALLLASACAESVPLQRPLVTLPQGAYRGRTAEQDVVAFLGIPYAQAPVGERRWREAVPLSNADTIADAIAFGPTCRQARDENEVASMTPQGEDCLSVNVWTRRMDGSPRPVLLWIHGGANVSGGTADPLYDGGNFVRDNDVVLVSINYRLGPFGFLDVEEQGGAAYRRSRNVGLLDQLAALRWVRANIGAFGGDSANVTLFGESAGGSAIMRLLSMPLARGLFDKAIIESGGPANIRIKGYPQKDEIATGRELTRALMTEARVSDMPALVALPADSVLAAARRVALGRGDQLGVSTWGARADDEVLPADVFGDIGRGANPDVKVLIGTNEDEMLYFRLYDTDFERSLMREYREKGSVMGRDFRRVRAAADEYTAGSTDPMRYVDFAGEYWLRQPSILLAEGQAQYNDVYMYLFTWDSAVPGMGACHACELPFVFGHLSGTEAESLTGPDPPAALSRRIQAAWTNFATTGDPSVAGEPAWPRYTVPTRATVLITDGPWTVVNDPKGDARRTLRGMYDVGR